MKRVNYLNNRDLMAEIHKSKNTYCSYVNPEDSQYDIIVPNLKKINVRDASEKYFKKTIAMKEEYKLKMNYKLRKKIKLGVLN